MIYLVTGFMRSGTSMMMAALEAGGLPTAKSRQRDAFARAHSDQHYQMNPTGLYELTPREFADPDFPAPFDGFALKAVPPWVFSLPVHAYRAVMMLRDAEEIRQSCEAAFGARYELAQIRRAQTRIAACLRNRRDVFSLTHVEYREVLARPRDVFVRLHDDGWPMDADQSATVVDPARVRFRREHLVEGL